MGVYFRQHAKTFPRNTQIKASMPQQNQSIEFSNHLPPANTKFSFGWNFSSYHAPRNHPGKKSSPHSLPSRKRKAEKTSGLFEPETKLHIREYMITKDKDDFSSAMRNISTKPTKGNLPQIEHLRREELPQGEKNWPVSLYQPQLKPSVQDGLLIPGLSLLPEPFSQTVQLRPSSAQSSSTALVPWEPMRPRTNRFNNNNPSNNLWHRQTASSPAYGIADICEILDDVKDNINCAHTDGEDEKMELN